jgi:hypothetical protein
VFNRLRRGFASVAAPCRRCALSHLQATTGAQVRAGRSAPALHPLRPRSRSLGPAPPDHRARALTFMSPVVYARASAWQRRVARCDCRAPHAQSYPTPPTRPRRYGACALVKRSLTAHGGATPLAAGPAANESAARVGSAPPVKGLGSGGACGPPRDARGRAGACTRRAPATPRARPCAPWPPPLPTGSAPVPPPRAAAMWRRRSSSCARMSCASCAVELSVVEALARSLRGASVSGRGGCGRTGRRRQAWRRRRPLTASDARLPSPSGRCSRGALLCGPRAPLRAAARRCAPLHAACRAHSELIVGS